MKKIFSIILSFILLMIFIFSGKSYALSLDTISTKVDKTTVRPGEEVKITIDFGKQLGAYTFDVAYDNKIFEYVSADGGTANDTTDKVRVVFHDSSGGTNARENMSVTFRAKSDITTSNPTEFSVTGEGLSNADASETYDDITMPMVENLTVEPEYKDYVISLTHTGDIVKGQEKEMKLSYSSPMGHYYEHARLIAEATTPANASVKLTGINADTSAEQDIIQSGWGDPQGYKIGGKDVLQELNVKALFSDAGDYTITLKLIDRDNSDATIAEKTFNFKVAEEQQTEQPEENQPGNSENENQQPTTEGNQQVEEKPEELPKTGNNIFVLMGILIVLISAAGIIFYFDVKSK